MVNRELCSWQIKMPMSSYQEVKDQLRKELYDEAAKHGNGKHLEAYLKARTKEARMYQRALAEIQMDMQDYSGLVANAKKKFTWLDIAIIDTLMGLGEYCGGYKYIEEGVKLQAGRMPADPQKSIRLSVRRMMRKGLVELQNGLFTEDGEPAGSGFTIRERRRDTVQMILSNYREEQMELL